MLAHSILELRGAGMATFTGEWSRWDDMMRFVTTVSPDRLTASSAAWARANLDIHLGTQDVDIFWVYDRQGRLLYSAHKDKAATLGDLPTLSDASGPRVVRPTGGTALRHFFLSSPLGPVEVRAARVLPTLDENRKGVSSGYLFAGRLWDEERVSELGRLLDAKAYILKAPAATVPASSEIVADEIFQDAEGHQSWVLRIVSHSQWLDQQNAASQHESLAVALFVASLLGILALGLRHWVGLPLQSIMRALRTGETAALHSGFIATTTEFKELAHLVQNSHRQRKELENQKRELGQAQEAIQRQGAFYRSLLDAAPNMIFVETADGTLTFVNRTAAETFGDSAEALVNHNVTDFISDPETLQAIHEVGQRVLASPGEIVVQEERVPLRNGQVRWTQTAKRAVSSLEGDEHQILVVITDITERKQTEERLRHLMNSARCLLWSADISEASEPNRPPIGDNFVWDFLYFDDTAAQRFLPLEVPPGQTYSDAAYASRHPEDRERTDRIGHEKIRRGENYSQEYRVQRSDGEWRWLHEDVYVEAREPGRWRAVGVVTDVTDLKQAQARAEEAQARAEEGARVKSAFLANMSHEIRTPMNGVIGMTGILLDTELTEEQRDYAKTISNSAEALLTVLNDILDFSKLEAGKVTIESENFNLRLLVEEVLTLLAPRAHEKGLEALIMMIPPDFPELVQGDPTRLRQVLNNLVGNAIKFTDAGEVAVHCRLMEEHSDTIQVRIEVRDTGIGIPKEAQERLFQSFSQVDDSSTRRFGGTGLGLAISRQLIELMGGQIGLESEPGVGSVFFFEIPLRRQKAALQATNLLDAVPLTLPERLQGLRVLIVDDNATNRLILRQQLRSWGALPEETASGYEALSLLRRSLPGSAAPSGALPRESQRGFDLVLMDMQMPGMNGEQVARAIRGDSRLAHLPIILLTSMGIPQGKEALREIGFAGALAKPVRLEQLRSLIVEAVGEARGIAEPHASLLPRSAPTIADPAQEQSGLRILLAEDNKVNQTVARRLLEKAGYIVDLVDTGAAAVARIEQELQNETGGTGYVAVLMDVQMPEMDGFEATGRIRDWEVATRSVHLPIIAMTAHALEGDRERCLAAGMDDYISKPIAPQKLHDVLERWAPHLPGQPAVPER
jgi:PAS domain S-box-containing protein